MTRVFIDGEMYIQKTDMNIGDGNSGNRNSGYWNSGHRNSGDGNSGNWNSGYWNSGHRNSGDGNSGNGNSGHRNSGNWNSGNRNSGNRNSGNWNSGNRNSGNRNSGHRNSGNWNSGDGNSGYFNIDNPKLRIFGKETDIEVSKIIFPDYFYFDLCAWINFDNMNDNEKKNYPFAKYTKGYLKTFDYKEIWKISFENATKKDIKLTLKLPNFDYKIFEQITGISKKMFDKKLK